LTFDLVLPDLNRRRNITS